LRASPTTEAAPAASPDAGAEYRARARAGIALLAKTFPRCFVVHEAKRKPVKIGIDRDIAAKLGAMPPALSIALKYYVGNAVYLAQMRDGAPRIDLNGKPAGAVTADQAANARARLAGRKKKSAAPAAHPPTNETPATLHKAAGALSSSGPSHRTTTHRGLTPTHPTKGRIDAHVAYTNTKDSAIID
jgi:sRNA-binding protein